MSKDKCGTINFFKFCKLTNKPFELVSWVSPGGECGEVGLVADNAVERYQFIDTISKFFIFEVYKRGREVSVIKEVLELLWVLDPLWPGCVPFIDDWVLFGSILSKKIKWICVMISKSRVNSNIIKSISDFLCYSFDHVWDVLFIEGFNVVRNRITAPEGKIWLDIILDML